MSTKFFSNFVIGAGLALILGLSGVLIAQPGTPFPAICHHPPGQGSNHGSDEIVTNGVAHYNGTHPNDHPPVNGSCNLSGGTGDPVPEPVTMLLFGAGLAGVGYAVRRRKQKVQ